MKNLLTVLTFLLSVLSLSAGPITRGQAQKKAEAFMKTKKIDKKLLPVSHQRKLAPGQGNTAISESCEYYVFNKGTREGFIIVSGDDQTEPILGYCDEGEFDYQQLPPNMKEWLDDYASQIAAIQSGKAPYVSEVIPTHPKVEQLMKSKWSQGNPYNLSCPEYFSLGRSVTGCVATAMAQLLYYNREKSVSETTAAMPAYDTWTEHATYGRLHVEGIPEGSPIDWENMKDEYGSANEKQKKAVADLMHYCGVAVKMDYTNSSSGAQSNDAYKAFINYFGYGSSVRYVSYSQVSTDTEWDRIIYAEIAAGRPIYISGSNSEAGHAFCADGYDGNLRYHINWGWGGTSDGYYLLTQLTPGQQGIGGSNDGYNGYREIIIGLEPENYSEKGMSFSDATVGDLCIQHFDANGDGILTYGEAAEVKELGTVFKGTSIKSFKELYYFTGLTVLPDDAFNGCSLLTTLRLPKNIKSIGNRALKDCAKLPKVEIPSHITSIGEEAFSGCTSLSSMILPDELSIINDGTFAGTAISTMSLPITVNRIGKLAFANCSRLSDIEVKTYLPTSIVLESSAFEGTDLSNTTLTCMQGTKSYFTTTDVWKNFGKIVEKRERSAGNFAKLETGKPYYLYHIGTGQYLTKGEAWGTQAIVGDTPMRFVIDRKSNMPEGVYYLTSEDTGKDGKYLFRTSTDANVGRGVMASFVDGTGLSTSAYWTIQEVSDKVYRLQIPSTASGYAEGSFWGVQTNHASNAASPTYGVYSDIDYEEHPTGCQWRLVPYDEQQVKTYEAAMALGNLLGLAKTRHFKVDIEQAVFDNLESSYDDLRGAQRTLRKKLGIIDFADDYVREVCVSQFDIDSDNELSTAEAAKVNDLGWYFYSYFVDNTSLISFDELQYFTNIPSVYGNTFQGCVNLESIVLPENLVNIYYNAFTDCKKLQSINLPEFIGTIGPETFKGCTALRKVTCLNPDPSTIDLGEDAFKNVPLASCTLYVPFGSKELYAQAPVWKNFGTIVEIRSHTQPRLSPIIADMEGYVLNLSTRKYIAMGEAYGTQSVVSQKGLVYQFKRSNTMPEGVYYLYSNQTGKDGKVLFRTDTDSKVGEGVKACFGDGSLSNRAYWKLDSIGGNVYTLQIPDTEESYVSGEYLGVNASHTSSAASPTYGLYYDVRGEGTKWAFVTVEDMETATQLDTQAEALAEMLKKAKQSNINVDSEQAVYDNYASTFSDLKAATLSVRDKLHLITFADEKARNLCLTNWDTDQDGELTYEEAAAVTNIGEVFRGASTMKSFEEFRYFTSLTEIPSNAFRSAMSLHTIILPPTVTSIGEMAFTGCSKLSYLVILNEDSMIPMGLYGLINGTTLFVPGKVLDDYSTNEEWIAKCTVEEYTGIPEVTATASRQYGRTSAAIKMVVKGAPVDGTASGECSAIADRYMPVGSYPITVSKGSITTEGVTFHDGVFTIVPAPLTITAKSYTRNVGEENPEFELTYKSFRNRETDTVFTVRPIISCEATADSPAGEYVIVVSGAEASNYEISYVNGKLTVLESSGINDVLTDEQQLPVYDLQGRRVSQPKHGIYLKGKRKVVVK